MTPNQTITRFDSSVRFTQACLPAEMIKTAPIVGSSAQ